MLSGPARVALAGDHAPRLDPVYEMERQSPTRREGRRLEMAADIIATARGILRAGGMNAVSLRAIARKVGVTPGAIYRYFPDLSALIDALHDDIFNDLSTAIIATRDQSTDDGSAERVQQMARAMRKWALDHPTEFNFSLGPGQGGASKPVAAWEQPTERILTLASMFLSEFTRSPQHYLANSAFLSAWVKLYGLVTLESSGNLQWMSNDIDTLFHIVLAELVEQLPGDYSWTSVNR